MKKVLLIGLILGLSAPVLADEPFDHLVDCMTMARMVELKPEYDMYKRQVEPYMRENKLDITYRIGVVVGTFEGVAQATGSDMEQLVRSTFNHTCQAKAM